MDWGNLRFFLAVARSGRISAAARQLGVEHTTVGRRLAALEEELGVPVFYRTLDGYRLTPRGESVLSSAEAMERAATAIGARAREGSNEIAGRVRLALLEEFASHWLAPHLPAFRARHPAIDLQILVGTLPMNLSRGEAELAVRTPRPRQAGLSAVRLARCATGLYATKALLGGKRLRIENADSAGRLPFLVYTPEFGAVLQGAAWFEPVLRAANVVLSSNSTETLVAAARASLGIAVLPRLAARTHGDLLAVSEDVGGSDAWLVTHPEFRRDPKVHATAEFLKRVAMGPGGLC